MAKSRVEYLKNKTFKDRPEAINREGRPKGTKNRSTIARKILEMSCVLPKNNFEKLKELYPEIAFNMTIEEVMTIIQANKAITKQDTAAYEKLLDSAYGKPAQDLSIASTLDEHTLDLLIAQINGNEV